MIRHPQVFFRLTLPLSIAIIKAYHLLYLCERKPDIMIRSIIHDPISLARPSLPAGPEDLSVAEDLCDTLRANAEKCVGMAANMIGVHKRIIVVDNDGKQLLMLNPEILKKSGIYDTEEGCLSLEGVRPAKRYRSIKVRYQNTLFQTRIKTYTGWTAQIIQHEIDHLNGVLI